MGASALDRLGRRIAQARKQAGLTQVQLAEKIDAHSNTIARYERGELDPTSTQLRLLARALQVSADQLLS